MKDKENSQKTVLEGECTRRGFLGACACAGVGWAFTRMGFSDLLQQSKDGQLSDEFRMMAYCCLECDECEAYIATINNDDKLKAKVAKEWKKKPGEIYCEGCRTDTALYNCSARVCAREKEMITCAHCPDFPSCDKDVWTKWPQLKKKTEDVRKKLKRT